MDLEAWEAVKAAHRERSHDTYDEAFPLLHHEKYRREVDAQTAALFAMYEPSKDPATLNSRLYQLVLDGVHSRNKTNTCPDTEPTYSVAERTAVEVWRQRVRSQVATRIDRYPPLIAGVTSTSSKPKNSPPKRSEHHVFQVPELLDLILHFAGPEAQVHALDVAIAWRTSAISVISNPRNVSGFRFSHPYAPVEYGQTIDSTFVSQRPSSKEVEEFGAHLRRLIRRQPDVTWRKRYLYFPARISQLCDLPDNIAQALNDLDVQQRHNLHGRINSISRTADNICWLDLSQFVINPYFNHLFAKDDRIKHRFGRWEITLRPSNTPDGLLFARSSATSLLLDNIGSMHITDPPCQTLGIYHYDSSTEASPSFQVLLKRISNSNGVRVSDIHDALEQLTPGVLSTWRRNAGDLHERVRELHWIDSVWWLPATPKIVIRLDNTAMVVDPDFDYEELMSGSSAEVARSAVAERYGYGFHITRLAYMSAEPFRATRQGEWVSNDLFEPMKSTTGRSPINWDL
ncbi:uncharacterized protein K460DRAFT_366342 [Cucurbitaria berberidis CBS 394.84]|uniref:Uncharacterized protein n=1 Tax=Cucurbitaria berberidis CBS 394.84 TaxID=1168544 RepID=A0A9P4GH13_9PLEO|nr:uncharacterized protein K460DRAFT_366342 [Cucurbitaria berberidis CBS 394.84]KAF1845462.1 hypothetical protein K460DRAFT_366342 [Cucurbitaria berberidis CBS 394.84]